MDKQDRRYVAIIAGHVLVAIILANIMLPLLGVT